MSWRGSIVIFLVGCGADGVADPAVEPTDVGIPVGELIRGVHTCRKLPNLDACAMSAPVGTAVLAPFDGRLVNLDGPPTEDPLGRIMDGSFYSTGMSTGLSLYLGPLEMDIPLHKERSYRAGEVIGYTTEPELLVTLWYSNGKLRPLIHEAMPGQWPDHVPIPYKPE